MLAQLSGAVLGALPDQGAVAGRGSSHPLRRRGSQRPAGRQLRRLDRRGGRHLLPRPRDPRRGLLEEEPQGLGAAGDRHHPRLHRHGRRPADRRLPSTRPAGSAPPSSATSSAASGPTWSARSSARCLPPPSSGSCSRPGGPAPTEPPERVKRGRRAEEAAEPPAPSPSPPADPSLRTAGPGRPGGCSSLGGVRRVTFSRNFTLSLSRTCQCYCKYCAFATHQAHIHAPEEVERLPRRGAETQHQGAARPHRRAARGQPVVAERLAEWGHEDFTSYVVWACERALERGMLPHTNLGVLEQGGPGPAARGHRLPGPDARVDRRAADGDRPRRLADQASRRRAWRRSRPPAS